MVLITAILALCGICLSTYAYFLEKKIAKDQTYKPFCDISDKISCSKTFSSPYGKLFNVSNGLWGILFYSTILVASIIEYHTALFLLSVLGVLVSFVLAIILYGIIKTVCLICTSIYIINILLLIAAYFTL